MTSGIAMPDTSAVTEADSTMDQAINFYIETVIDGFSFLGLTTSGHLLTMDAWCQANPDCIPTWSTLAALPPDYGYTETEAKTKSAKNGQQRRAKFRPSIAIDDDDENKTLVDMCKVHVKQLQLGMEDPVRSTVQPSPGHRASDVGESVRIFRPCEFESIGKSSSADVKLTTSCSDVQSPPSHPAGCTTNEPTEVRRSEACLPPDSQSLKPLDVARSDSCKSVVTTPYVVPTINQAVDSRTYVPKVPRLSAQAEPSRSETLRNMPLPFPLVPSMRPNLSAVGASSNSAPACSQPPKLRPIIRSSCWNVAHVRVAKYIQGEKMKPVNRPNVPKSFVHPSLPAVPQKQVSVGGEPNVLLNSSIKDYGCSQPRPSADNSFASALSTLAAKAEAMRRTQMALERRPAVPDESCPVKRGRHSNLPIASIPPAAVVNPTGRSTVAASLPGRTTNVVPPYCRIADPQIRMAVVPPVVTTSTFTAMVPEKTKSTGRPVPGERYWPQQYGVGHQQQQTAQPLRQTPTAYPPYPGSDMSPYLGPGSQMASHHETMLKLYAQQAVTLNQMAAAAAFAAASASAEHPDRSLIPPPFPAVVPTNHIPRMNQAQLLHHYHQQQEQQYPYSAQSGYPMYHPVTQPAPPYGDNNTPSYIRSRTYPFNTAPYNHYLGAS